MEIHVGLPSNYFGFLLPTINTSVLHTCLSQTSKD